MNFPHLTDESLNLEMLELVKSEREVLIKILHRLREVERRRLFSKLKFQSLFEYAIKFLGYSEDQAARRITAMRLLKELPAIEEKIESGALTLSHLTKAQAIFRREKKADRPRSVEAKLDLLSQIESAPIRAAEKTLEEAAYAQKPKEEKKPLSMDQFSDELQAKLTRLMEVRSHSAGNLHDVIDQLADLGLAKWDPIVKAERASKRVEKFKDADDAVVPATFRVNEQQQRPEIETEPIGREQ
ncbi:MAG: hypothetical protein AAB250_00065, partial [Bdellovibrionota bacterium]